jgi:glycerophosphoryl diester phosphodiesterase
MLGAAYFSGPRPRLFGHRGAAGILPENTMPSFRKAIEGGADALELDVHATRDGVVVVIHDETIERTTDGAGAVRELTFAELSRHDAGARFAADGGFPFRGQGIRVPALEEVVDAFPTVPLNIEIKQAEVPIEDAVVSLLERKNAIDRVMLAAEHDVILQRIRRRAPDAATSASYDEARDFFQRCFANDFGGYTPRARALQIPVRVEQIELVSAMTVEAAHDHGLEMHVWTINEEDEMERLIRLGVDGVMSDFPARLVAVARRLGLRK